MGAESSKVCLFSYIDRGFESYQGKKKKKILEGIGEWMKIIQMLLGYSINFNFSYLAQMVHQEEAWAKQSRI